jgi:hypothetical protein
MIVFRNSRKACWELREYVLFSEIGNIPKKPHRNIDIVVTATAPMTLTREQSLEDTARLRALGGLNKPAAGNLVLPAGPGSFQSPSAEEPASRSERVALQHIMILICIHAHTHTHTHTCMLALKAQLCVHVNGATDDILPLSHSPSLLACHRGNNTSY